MNSLLPVEIVGGGLAGLGLGLALQRAGVPTTILEAGTYPRHRVCGEFITGLDRATVARLGLGRLLTDAVRHRRMTWFVPGRQCWTETLPRTALGISRFALDARLAVAFLEAGGDLKTGTRVVDPVPHVGRIFATGRQRSAAAWLGLKLHADSLALSADLELHLGDQAYVGLSKVEDGTVNVCGLFRQQPTGGYRATARAVSSSTAGPAYEVMLRQLEASGLGGVGERLRSADIKVDSFCAVAGLGFGHQSIAPSRLSIGDAYAMPPPFTGNGMAMAFQSAALAADPLVAYSRGEIGWDAACGVIDHSIRKRFRLRLASALTLHPFLLRPVHQRLFARLSCRRLIPFRPIFALLH